MSMPAVPPVAAEAVPDALRASSRVVGIDLARGIALLGMMATHVLVVTDDDDMLTPVGAVFAGRASALFALLAGVSLALVTGGERPYAGRDRARASVAITIRALLIGLLGLVLVELEAPVAVILAYYAVLFVLALPFLGLGTRPLAWLAVSWAVLAPVVSHVVRDRLPPGPGEQVGLEVALTRPGEAITSLLVTGYYPAITWLAYLLAGLAVGRGALRARRFAGQLLVGGLALAATAWVVSTVLVAGVVDQLDPDAVAGGGRWAAAWQLQSSDAYGTLPATDWRFLLPAGRHTGTPFDLLHTMGSALAVLGACLLLTRADAVRRLTRPVSALGSMTLTFYTAHVLVLLLELGTWGRPAYYWAQVAAALVLAPLWLLRFRRGPLEQVVHSVSSDIARAVVPRRE